MMRTFNKYCFAFLLRHALIGEYLLFMLGKKIGIFNPDLSAQINTQI